MLIEPEEALKALREVEERAISEDWPKEGYLAAVFLTLGRMAGDGDESGRLLGRGYISKKGTTTVWEALCNDYNDFGIFTALKVWAEQDERESFAISVGVDRSRSSLTVLPKERAFFTGVELHLLIKEINQGLAQALTLEPSDPNKKGARREPQQIVRDPF